MHILNRPFVHALFILLAVSLVYSNTINAPFEFDDLDNIVYNPAIKDVSLSPGTGRETSEQTTEHIKPLLRTRSVGYWTFAMNNRVHGFDVRGYHLTNILIHVIVSLLLYRLVLLTFRTPFFAAHGGTLPEGSRGFIALFAALLFATHPVQTQAVTYIVQRFASLAALLYLLALVLYLQFRISIQASGPGAWPPGFKVKARAWSLYAGSLLSAILAMKTKEFAFTLPAMMVLYEIMFPTGTGRKRFLYLLPYVLASLIIPLSLVDAGGTIGDTYETAAKVSGASDSISRESYLFTQFRVIVTYLRLLVFPVNQNLDYDYPVYTSFFVPEVLFSFLFLLSLLGLGTALYRLSRGTNLEARPWLRLMSFGIFWFFLTIAAESGIIPIADVIFEHRLYLPSAGLSIAFVAAVDLAGARWRTGTAFKKIPLYLMVLAVSVLSVAAYSRNAVWRQSLSLCEDMVRKSPGKARTWYHLGLAYDDKGRTEEAIGAYEKALTKKEAYSLLTDIYNNLGVAYMRQGRIHEAVRLYKTALNFKPDDVDLRYNLANGYSELGCLDEAIREYQTAIRQTPADAKIHYFLGVAYSQQENVDDAIREFQIVKKLNPDDTMAGNNLEILAAKQMTARTSKGKRAPSRKGACNQ